MGPHSETIFAKGKAGSQKMEAVKNFTGLASDSREVKQGYLFAALPGTKANGAEFMADAVKRGAVAILARPDAAQHAKDLGVRFIADENPRLGLARAAAEFYGAQPDTIAAVTGTNGKTSVAVFLRQIWTTLRQARRQPRHHRCRHASRRNRAEAHHARSGGNPPPAGAIETRWCRASCAGSLQPRP